MQAVDTVRRLHAGELAALCALQSEAAAGLPAGFLQGREAEALRAALEGQGGRTAWGVHLGEELLAAALLWVPGPEGLGGLPFPRVPPADWPGGVAFLESAMVRPAARGRGLQRALVAQRVDHARRLGLLWACAGTHLLNPASWTNLMAEGFSLVGLRLDRGYPIAGLLLPLRQGGWAGGAGETLEVAAGDTQGHMGALALGYVGRRFGAGRVTYVR